MSTLTKEIVLGPPGSAYGAFAGSFQYPGTITAGFERSAELGPNFQFVATTVPEPTTLTLATLGLLSLGFVGWRRRRR